uniref:BCL2 associated agonist of cell death n=1 Tax=Equus asinus asinus TaxID=83772 RepID=A0A8C4PTQ2_EQUAS
MFQIPEFEQSEPEDSSPADRGLGPSPTGDWPSDPVRHQRTAPGLLGEAGHQQGQPASSSHHGGAGAVETRSRHSSYPEGTEDEGMEGEEPGPFRGRSRSAPPNLWAALRYGRELRRMSDEFQGSFQVSAGAARTPGPVLPGHLPLGCPIRVPVHVGTDVSGPLPSHGPVPKSQGMLGSVVPGPLPSHRPVPESQGMPGSVVQTAP